MTVNLPENGQNHPFLGRSIQQILKQNDLSKHPRRLLE